MVCSSSPPSPRSTNSTSTPSRSRNASSGPRPPGCSWRVVSTRSPAAQGSALTRQVEPVARAVGERDVVGGRDDHRGDGRARLPHPLQDLGQQVGQAAADRELALRLLVHRALGLGRHGSGGPRVEVDAGARRGQQRPDRGHLGRLRHEGGDHVRIISTPPARTVTPRSEDPVAGFARPELIATPEWLAENIGRPDLRVIDVRWRPDGSAATLYGTGHIPGAVHLDWRTSVVDAADVGDALLLDRARPHGRRDVPGRRRGRDVRRPVRRHAVVLRVPGLVEPARLRLRVGADPRGRLSRLDRGRAHRRQRRGAGRRRRPSRRARRCASG